MIKNLNLFDVNSWGYIILAIIICSLILLAIIMIIAYIINGIPHTCKVCNTKKTTQKNDKGEYQCEKCTNKLLINEAKKTEKIRICPDCKYSMDKHIIDGTNTVADLCPSCKGVFLDKDKLEQLDNYTRVIIFKPSKKKK